MIEFRRWMRRIEDDVRDVGARVDEDHVEAMRQHPHEVIVAAVEARREVAERHAQKRPMGIPRRRRSDETLGAQVGQALDHVAVEMRTALRIPAPHLGTNLRHALLPVAQEPEQRGRVVEMPLRRLAPRARDQPGGHLLRHQPRPTAEVGVGRHDRRTARRAHGHAKTSSRAYSRKSTRPTHFVEKNRSRALERVSSTPSKYDDGSRKFSNS